MCFFSFCLKELKSLLESKFKTALINEIEQIFPGCIVIHPNPNEIQGFPDLIILYNDQWAALEGKRNINSPCQPNQEHYVELLNNMSHAWFIYPENKQEVLHDLQLAFRTRRSSRLPKR